MAGPDDMDAPETSAADAPQPKAALHYRAGGDHCGVCMYFTGVGDGKGTCTKVTPPDVDAGDLCDEFGRSGREKPDAEVGGKASPETAEMAGQLARRGLISDTAMKKYVG